MQILKYYCHCHCIFSAESNGERILQIGHYFGEDINKSDVVFFTNDVFTWTCSALDSVLVCTMKEISDEKERIQAIYGLIARLPPVNHNLLERLVFHLTRLFECN